MTEEFVNRNGLLIPATSRRAVEQAAIKAHREKHGMADVTPQQQQAARKKMRDSIGAALDAAVAEAEPIFGGPQQGNAALQLALVTAIDIGAANMALSFGFQAAIDAVSVVLQNLHTQGAAAHIAANAQKQRPKP